MSTAGCGWLDAWSDDGGIQLVERGSEYELRKGVLLISSKMRSLVVFTGRETDAGTAPDTLDPKKLVPEKSW